MRNLWTFFAGFLSAFTWYAASASLALAQGLQNPLQYNTIGEFVAGALKALVLIALPIVAFFLLLAGFQYISAQGNAEKIKDSHRNFLWVVIGGALMLGAWVLATLIGGTVQQVIGQ